MSKATVAKEVDTETGEVVSVKDVRDQIVPLSFDEAMSIWSDDIIEVKSDWEVVDKKELVNIPFVIQQVRFYEGNFGPAVAAMAVTQGNRRVVFNDGSSGVREQIRELVNRHQRHGGFLCPHGLRFSEYEYQEEDFDGNPIGDLKKTRTYYIA